MTNIDRRAQHRARLAETVPRIRGPLRVTADNVFRIQPCISPFRLGCPITIRK